MGGQSVIGHGIAEHDEAEGADFHVERKRPVGVTN